MQAELPIGHAEVKQKPTIYMFNHYWEMRRERPALYCNDREQRETQEPSPNGAQSSRFLRRMERTEGPRIYTNEGVFPNAWPSLRAPSSVYYSSASATHKRSADKNNRQHWGVVVVSDPGL